MIGDDAGMATTTKKDRNKTLELGDQVKDKITGFEGIAIGHTRWIHGSDRFTEQAQTTDKDGKPGATSTFDEAQLDVVKKFAYVTENRWAQAETAAEAEAPAQEAARRGGPGDEPERREDVTR
jgi:hypothetical protein